MTKQEILQYFCDINMAYNDSSKYDTLARMIDELLKEQEEEISKISKVYLELVGKASKQPEIVRCKDCKYYHKPEYGFTIGDCTYGSAWFQTNEDGFCNKAKRK